MAAVVVAVVASVEVGLVDWKEMTDMPESSDPTLPRRSVCPPTPPPLPSVHRGAPPTNVLLAQHTNLSFYKTTTVH